MCVPEFVCACGQLLHWRLLEGVDEKRACFQGEWTQMRPTDAAKQPEAALPVTPSPLRHPPSPHIHSYAGAPTLQAGSSAGGTKRRRGQPALRAPPLSSPRLGSWAWMLPQSMSWWSRRRRGSPPTGCPVRCPLWLRCVCRGWGLWCMSSELLQLIAWQVCGLHRQPCHVGEGVLGNLPD